MSSTSRFIPPEKQTTKLDLASTGEHKEMESFNFLGLILTEIRKVTQYLYIMTGEKL